MKKADDEKNAARRRRHFLNARMFDAARETNPWLAGRERIYHKKITMKKKS
jgi:hypothetical protein